MVDGEWWMAKSAFGRRADHYGNRGFPCLVVFLFGGVLCGGSPRIKNAKRGGTLDIKTPQVEHLFKTVDGGWMVGDER